MCDRTAELHRGPQCGGHTLENRPLENALLFRKMSVIFCTAILEANPSWQGTPLDRFYLKHSHLAS